MFIELANEQQTWHWVWKYKNTLWLQSKELSFPHPKSEVWDLWWIFHAMETLMQQPGRLKHALVSPMLYSTTLNKPEKRRVGYESCPDF